VTKGTDRFLPSRVNLFVPNMEYAADVDEQGYAQAELGAPNAAVATQIANLATLGTTGSASYDSSLQTLAVMGLYGRQIQFVGSGATTAAVTITGYDYLGQKITELLTGNGTTPVLSVKAYARVVAASWTGGAAVNYSLGTANGLGLPYRALALERELVDGVIPAAGALVAGLATATPQTNATADPRGIYTPNAAVVPNGSRRFRPIFMVDTTALYGAAHFAA
jgi:hypothetical protein